MSHALAHPTHWPPPLLPQGEEARVVILSLTRNNAAGTIGFLKMRNRWLLAACLKAPGAYSQCTRTACILG